MGFVVEFNRDIFYTHDLLNITCKLLGFTSNGLLCEDIRNHKTYTIEPITSDKRHHIRIHNMKLDLEACKYYTKSLKEYTFWKTMYNSKARQINEQNILELSGLIKEVQRLISIGQIVPEDKIIDNSSQLIDDIVSLCEDMFVTCEGISYLTADRVSRLSNCKITIREKFNNIYIPIGVIDVFGDLKAFIRFNVFDYMYTGNTEHEQITLDNLIDII